jgi:hypothetical protein
MVSDERCRLVVGAKLAFRPGVDVKRYVRASSAMRRCLNHGDEDAVKNETSGMILLSSLGYE